MKLNGLEMFFWSRKHKYMDSGTLLTALIALAAAVRFVHEHFSSLVANGRRHGWTRDWVTLYTHAFTITLALLAANLPSFVWLKKRSTSYIKTLIAKCKQFVHSLCLVFFTMSTAIPEVHSITVGISCLT